MVVNPYTFVSLPATPPERGRPTWHHRQAVGCYDGQINIRLVAVNPLMLGPLNAAEMGEHDGHPVAGPPRARAGDTTSPVIVTGSSLMGAIRSVHEAMNNSCLRIVDEDYRAVHRLAMTTSVSADLRDGRKQSNDGPLRMAVVTAAADGCPSKVALCSDVIWLRHDHFSVPPTTGDRYDLDGVPTFRKVTLPSGRMVDGGKKKYDGSPGTVLQAAGASWVVLVTDTAARPPGPAWFACGRLDPDESALEVQAEARVAFARAVEGSSDMNGEAATATITVPVPGGTAIAGYRKPWKGDVVGLPVWVKADWDEPRPKIDEIRLAVAWRRVSDVTVRDRIEGWEPCTHFRALCPSCALFGSAGADRKQADEATQQLSYRGHVRIDDARSTMPVQLSAPFWRAPLSEPRPTAGQFYLANHDGGQGAKHPLAQWGSEADALDEPRRIRGRKFYWRTQATGDSRGERGQARDHHFGEGGAPSTQISQVQLVGAGTTFEARLTFENLTRHQIGSLLAAIDPGLVLTGRGHLPTLVTSIGGGRPFGWGAVSMKVVGFSAADARQRYLGAEDAGPSQSSCVATYQEWSPDWKDSVWCELGIALTMDAVQDAMVWYPATTTAARQSAEYDTAFPFWKRTSGIGGEGGGPLRSLPAVTNPDQSL